jgi:hypothetical protein
MFAGACSYPRRALWYFKRMPKDPLLERQWQAIWAEWDRRDREKARLLEERAKTPEKYRQHPEDDPLLEPAMVAVWQERDRRDREKTRVAAERAQPHPARMPADPLEDPILEIMEAWTRRQQENTRLAEPHPAPPEARIPSALRWCLFSTGQTRPHAFTPKPRPSAAQQRSTGDAPGSLGNEPTDSADKE